MKSFEPIKYFNLNRRILFLYQIYDTDDIKSLNKQILVEKVNLLKNLLFVVSLKFEKK